MIATTMKACQEYTSFVYDPSNRDIKDSHVDKLEEAVSDVYLLDAYPIVTTTERVIVDGQHRFRLAKSLGIPFYYIAGDGVTVDDIALANANTEKYRLEDALHVYSRLGLESYQYIENFWRKCHGFPIGYVAKILSSDFRTGDFVVGQYVIDRTNYAEDVVGKLADFAKYQKSVIKWPSYRRAVEILAQSSIYDHSRMLDRLNKNPRRVLPCGRFDEVLKLFTEEIYNYNIRLNRVDLTIAQKYCKPIPKGNVINSTLTSPRRGIVVSNAVLVCKETNLDKFTVHPTCRPTRNINKLVDAIRQKNLLEFYPIIVDRNMVVFDGQRRLEAARQLGLPIYYIVFQNISMWMIASAGGLAKSWGLADYLKHHAELGNPVYVRLREIMKKYDFLNAESFLLLGDHSAGNDPSRQKFKSGQYEIDNISLELFDFFRQLPPLVAKQNMVQRLVGSLYRRNRSSYFLTRMKNILTTNVDSFAVRTDSKAMSANLVALYNSGLTAEKRIEYSRS